MATIQLHIIDLGAGTGEDTAFISRASSEGTLGTSITTKFSTHTRILGGESSIPLVMRGLGPSIPKGIVDPKLFYTINNITGYNDDYSSSPSAALIASAGLTPPSGTESADLVYPNILGDHQVKLAGSGFNNRGKIELITLTGQDYWEEQNILTNSEEAWASYDVSSGVTSKSVFGYSLTMVDEISSTGNISLRNNPYEPSRLLYYSPVGFHGYCNSLNFVVGNSGLKCEIPENQPDEYEKCLKSGLNQDEIRAKTKSIIDDLLKTESGVGSVEAELTDDELINKTSSLEYVIYKGRIEYNSPYSGDRICFYSYPFNYTGEYSGKFNTNPPYNEFTKCWRYGIEYNSAQSLVNAINADLYSTDRYLWHPEICTDTSLSGYFENGPLLRAFIDDNDSNIINLESLRIGLAGNYRFSLYDEPRPQNFKEVINSIRYLLPSTVKLQSSSNGSSWTTLDTHSDIDWLSIKPGLIPVNYFDNFLDEEDAYNNPPQIDPNLSVKGTPAKKSLFDVEISGVNKCGQNFKKTVKFFEVPSGAKCPDEEDEDNDKFLRDLESGESDPNEKKIFMSIRKSGWKFQTPAPYNYYRVLLSDFRGEDRGLNVGITGEFKVLNINLYGTISGFPLHSVDACLLGSEYEADIRGITSGVLSGNIDVDLLELEDSFRTKQATAVLHYFFPTGADVIYINSIPIIHSTDSNQLPPNYFSSRDELTDIINDNSSLFKVTAQSISNSEGGDIILTAIDSGYKGNFIPIDVQQVSEEDSPYFGLITLTGGYSYLPSSGVFSVKNQRIVGHPRIITQANAILDYHIPINGDIIWVNDIPISYSIASGEGPPDYFRTRDGLADIINNDASFKVTAESVPNTGGGLIKLTAIPLGNNGNGIPVSVDLAGGETSPPSFRSSTTTGGYTSPADKVFFRSHSGVAITPFTGLLTDSVTGSGYYLENVQGYFYNPATTGLSFSKPVSGTIIGYGELSGGPYYIVEDFAINSLSPNIFQTITGSGYGLMQGVIPNFSVNFNNIQSFAYVSGSLSSSVSNGFHFYNDIISAFPSKAYLNTPTGYKQATAILDYNTPESGDSVIINGIPVTRSISLGLGPPTYFRSINELNSIINSGMDSFGVSGQYIPTVDGGKIKLTAIALGEEGNGVSLDSFVVGLGDINFESTQTTGGMNFYPEVTPTGLYSFLLNREVKSTGFFSVPVTGYVTGSIKQLNFVRKFEDIWSLRTGDLDYFSHGWKSGTQLTNLNTIGYLSYKNSATIPIGISYVNDPLVVSTDLVKLIVTGQNINSGINMIISGQY